MTGRSINLDAWYPKERKEMKCGIPLISPSSGLPPPMSDAIRKTFDFLATSANQFAVPVLMRGLDVPDEEVRSQAVAAILKRGQKHGFAELIRRYGGLPESLQRQIDASASRMRASLGDALEKGKPNVRENALRIIENAGTYSQVETLLRSVVANHPAAKVAMKTVRNLVDQLFDELSDADRSKEESRATKRSRQQLIVAIGGAVGKAANSPYLEDLVRAVLVIGEPDDNSIRNLLGAAESTQGSIAWQLLENEAHPGVMRLIFLLLMSRSVSDRLMNILETRNDPEFVLQLLRGVPDRFPETFDTNLKRITRLPWVDGSDMQFDWIPPGLQGRLVNFVSATGLDRDVIVDLQQWVVHSGSVVGRMAAVEALATMQGEMIEDAITAGLESDDADVQAWATSQLREQKIPEAFTLLTERLDSPMDEVRDAAREELESFDLHRMLDLFTELKPEVCRRAGELLRKINPNAIDELRSELRSPTHRRRVRAVLAAHALGMHPDVGDVLLEMLSSEDHSLLRAVIDALADLPWPEVHNELTHLCNDESPRIRTAAENALKKHEQFAAVAGRQSSPAPSMPDSPVQ